jgi:hypothetical protein
LLEGSPVGRAMNAVRFGARKVRGRASKPSKP